MLNKKNIVVDDEQVEFLAEAYLRLRNNPTYKLFSQTFQAYVDEFLEKELKAIRENKKDMITMDKLKRRFSKGKTEKKYRKEVFQKC